MALNGVERISGRRIARGNLSMEISREVLVRVHPAPGEAQQARHASNSGLRIWRALACEQESASAI